MNKESGIELKCIDFFLKGRYSNTTCSNWC